MPIRKAERVIEHRITFGKHERKLLEQVSTGYTFNKVTTPIVAGMSDVSFMVVLASLLALVGWKIEIPQLTGVPGELQAIIDAIKAEYERLKGLGSRAADLLNPIPEIMNIITEGTGGFDPLENLTPEQATNLSNIYSEIYSTTPPGNPDWVPGTPRPY